MKNFRNCLAAALLLASSQVIATPITLGFSGTLTSATDSTGNWLAYTDPSFTGTFTFDLAVQAGSYVDSYGLKGFEVITHSGCPGFLNGECVSPTSVMPSVVTGFTLQTALGYFEFSPDTTGGATSTGLTKYTVPQNTSYFKQVNYALENVTNYEFSDANARDLVYVYQGMNIIVQGGPETFHELLNLAEIPMGKGRLGYSVAYAAQHCPNDDYCVALPGSGFSFGGDVEELHLAKTADIPEPATALLILAGAAGMATRRSTWSKSA